jgi:hypothetical protein
MQQALTDETPEEVQSGLYWLGEQKLIAQDVQACRDEINSFGIRPEEFFVNALRNNDILAIADAIVHEHRPMALHLLSGLKQNGITHVLVRAYSADEEDWLTHFMLFDEDKPIARNSRVRLYAPLLLEMRQLGLKLITTSDKDQNSWQWAADILSSTEFGGNSKKLLLWDNHRRLRVRSEAGTTYADVAPLKAKEAEYTACSAIGLRSPLCPNALDPIPWLTFIAGDLQFPIVVPTAVATSIGELPISSIMQDRLNSWDYVIIYPFADHRQLL